MPLGIGGLVIVNTFLTSAAWIATSVRTASAILGFISAMRPHPDRNRARAALVRLLGVYTDDADNTLAELEVENEIEVRLEIRPLVTFSLRHRFRGFLRFFRIPLHRF
jgi:hypothetical protein